jgi:hypothetical protein
MRGVVMRAAARPYPGEVPVPVHEDGVAVPDPGVRGEPAGLYALPLEPAGCTAVTKSGERCKGRAGDDGRCAAHKEA